MERQPHPPAVETHLGPLGLGVAVLGPIAVTSALLPFRGDIQAANTALVLVLTVLIAAVVGGRAGGVIAALVAAVSFDFLFTRPYYSFSINNGDDVQTVVLLLAVGLAVGEIVVRSRRSRAVADRRSRESEYLRHIAELTAGGESPGRLITVVQNELTAILDLKSARFERPPFPTSLPQLRHGGIRVELGAAEPEGLNSQVELPVRGGGQVLGRFVLTMPADGVGNRLPPDRRTLAAALADQLGAALAQSPGQGA